ncbi:MAG: RNA pseudouridine synthase [Treponema sp.]|nr:MAG: RNA pseudouridine synthase [Treponema sp.]
MVRSKLKAGLVELKLNGVKTKLSKNVFNGDEVELKWENPIPTVIQPENLKLKIVYEDKNIIVVNKPSGMVTHLACGNYRHTLVNALEYYRRNVSDYKDEFSTMSLELTDESIRRGIVHRLDKDTSGLIITARNYKTQNFLKSEFKKRCVKKYYLAILSGIPAMSQGNIKTSVFRLKSNARKFKASSDLTKGKFAYSKYRVLKTFGKYSLVLFRIYTGRTHQIRLHANFLGLSVVGDSLYGKKSDDGFMLHAVKAVFTEPDAKKKLRLKIKMPKRFLHFINKNK